MRHQTRIRDALPQLHAGWRAVALPVLAAVLLVGCGGGGGNDGAAGRQLVVEGPAELRGPVGQPLAELPTVRVLDRNGTPLAGVTVAFEASAGGTVSPATVVTDAQGRARPQQWILSTTAGPNTLAARLPTPQVLITAIGEPGPPSQIAAASPVQQVGTVDGEVDSPPAARVSDGFGNVLAGVAVEFSVVRGGGAISGSPAVTGSGGVATVSSWRLGPAEGTNEVVASVAGAGSASFLAEGLDRVAFSIDDVQLNQGSQSLVNDIEAVAGRPAMLRVVVSASRTNGEQPDVLVRLYRNGELRREEIVAFEGGGVPVSPNLAAANQTWNLSLEAEDVGPGLSVVAILDPDERLSAPSREGFRYPRGGGSEPIAVRSLAPLRVVFVPIHASRHGTTGNIHSGNVNAFTAGTHRWVPSGQLAADIRASFTTDLNLAESNNMTILLGDLQALRTDDGATDQYYVGIFRPSGGNIVGIAYLNDRPDRPFRSALSYDALPGAAVTVAHELAHNMGRRHSPCGEPDMLDPDFPYSGGGIGVPGYDILDRRLLGPGGYADFLGYCNVNWTSDYSYRALLEWRTGDPLAPQAAATTPLTVARTGSDPETQPGVLVWGHVNSRGVHLNPALTIQARPVLPDPDGPHLLRGSSADGRVLFELPFAGLEVAHAPDPAERHFVYFVPLTPADVESLVRIELSSPHGYAMQEAPATSPAALALARQELLATRLPRGGARLSWNRARHPLALVRDRQSGRVLAIARSGDIELPAGVAATTVPELLLSDGVRSGAAIPLELH